MLLGVATSLRHVRYSYRRSSPKPLIGLSEQLQTAYGQVVVRERL